MIEDIISPGTEQTQFDKKWNYLKDIYGKEYADELIKVWENKYLKKSRGEYQLRHLRRYIKFKVSLEYNSLIKAKKQCKEVKWQKK